MKMEEQDLIALISGYLDNALSPEETERLLEIIRRDPAAADLMCELSIQHVQLRLIFNPNIAREISNVRPPGFGVNDLRRSCSGLTLSNQQSASRLVSVEQVKRDAASVRQRDFPVVSIFSRFPPFWRPLALAACLAVIVAAGFRLAGFLRERDASRAATIVLLKVGQDLEDADAKRAEAAAAGATVIVPAGTIGLLRFKDGTIFELKAGSKAQIVDAGSEKSGKIVKLTSGTVIAGVTRQPTDFPLKVTTPHLEVIVAGTRLTCKVEKDHTHVRMHHGWAHIIHFLRGEKLKLEAGQHVTAGERFHFRVRAIHEGEH